MFEIFKRNKKKEVVPIFEALGTDMHCHLLPGVDDGSGSMEESVACMQTMHACGYKRVHYTPHYQSPRFPNTEEDIKQRYALLLEGMKKQDVELEMAGVAGEYRIDEGFEARMKENKFLKVNDQYLLVELSLHQPWMGVENILFDLHTMGYDVILAHPERYPYFGSRSEALERIKETGVLFQVNVLSLNGFYGESAQRNAFDMIENGWIDLMGTDMHNRMYASALEACTRNRQIQKIMETKEFLNNKL